MIPAFPLWSRVGSRSELAAARAGRARESLASCQLCSHHCGVNRLAGGLGPCRAGPTARVFNLQTEVADELEILPVFAIALSGCDLRCDFCVSGRESWDPSAGDAMDFTVVAERAGRAVLEGARTMMILGGEPTIHLPSVLELVAALPESIPVLWKTNGHGSAESRAFSEDVFDGWVVDYKFGNDACAERLAGVEGYTAAVRGNLGWAAAHSTLIVRHLLMPGHLDCCWCPVAEWIAAELPGVRVSLRTGFWPGWFSHRHPELKLPSPPAECARAHEVGRRLGLNLIR